MSYQDRDYFRDEPPSPWGGRGGFRGALARAPSKWILVVLVFVCYIVQSVMEGGHHRFGGDSATEFFGLSWDGLRAGRLWQLLTYGLLHVSGQHLLWNLIALWVFSEVLEENLGRGKVLSTAVFACVAGGLAYVLGQAMGPGRAMAHPVVGASGILMGIMARAVLTSPHRQLLLFFVLPVPLWVLGLLFLGGDLLGMAGIGSGSVAYIAHLGGVAAGAALHIVPNLLLRSRRRRPAAPAAPRMGLRPPEPADFAPPVQGRTDADEARVDLLLDRIHSQGMESLTEEEKAFLNEMSRRLRQGR